MLRLMHLSRSYLYLRLSSAAVASDVEISKTAIMNECTKCS